MERFFENSRGESDGGKGDEEFNGEDDEGGLLGQADGGEDQDDAGGGEDWAGVQAVGLHGELNCEREEEAAVVCVEEGGEPGEGDGEDL